MSRVVLLCLALLLSVSAGARAQGLLRGTPQEEAACRPDVARHCRAAMPDTFRVLACLQANRHKLTRACQRVLANNGQ